MCFLSVLIHILYILIFRSVNIFSRLSANWTSTSSKKRRFFSGIVILAVIVNISFKLVCIDTRKGIWGNLVLRIFLILLVTPTSVLLEWIVYRVIKAYIDLITNIFSSHLCPLNDEKLTLLSLPNMYLTQAEIQQTNQLIANATLPIKKNLEAFSLHNVEVVPTGSVFEMYGKPLAVPALETNLKSDYDVMFAFQKEEFLIEIAKKDDEFLHVFVLSNSCSMLNRIKKYDHSTKSFKLSAERTRQFMKTIVQDVQISYKDTSSKEKCFHKIWNLFAFLFNVPRIGRYAFICI